jgi:hypothetical protein
MKYDNKPLFGIASLLVISSRYVEAKSKTSALPNFEDIPSLQDLECLPIDDIGQKPSPNLKKNGKYLFI